jgi:hypothetical protein
MASTDTQQALRRIVARRDGYRCHYCGVPTAATLEHTEPLKRDKRGQKTNGDANSWLGNLRLACPYCNSTKGDRPVEDFVRNELWKLLPPPGLPQTTREVLTQCFGWTKREGIVYTGTTNARLEIRGGMVAVLVRSGTRDEWHRLALGPQTHPRIALAAWDFLRRHNTPDTPKRPTHPVGKGVGALQRQKRPARVVPLATR